MIGAFSDVFEASHQHHPVDVFVGARAAVGLLVHPQMLPQEELQGLLLVALALLVPILPQSRLAPHPHWEVQVLVVAEEFHPLLVDGPADTVH